ncbi:MAG: prohibitin family protein [Verrucomicrobiota bacterium]|nr:prohibitin family protein [Verrucomicrobiota bacterium]
MPTSTYNPRPPRSGGFPPVDAMERYILPRLLAVAAVVFLGVLISSTSTYVVEPGTRGIKVTLGKATDQFLPEGLGFKTPFITSIVPIIIKQRTQNVKADCFSSDLQQVMMELRVMYRVPQESVVQIYKQFSGDPFDNLIAPRIQEALKEITANQTAEQIVKSREEIKQKVLASARTKIGSILNVTDVVIQNIDLSPELERAIEAKMVAEQQAAQARFTQIQTQVEAETAIIRALGEAEAIRVRGEALKLNPAFLKLQLVERWDGRSPMVVPADAGSAPASLLLPLGETEKAAQ